MNRRSSLRPTSATPAAKAVFTDGRTVLSIEIPAEKFRQFLLAAHAIRQEPAAMLAESLDLAFDTAAALAAFMEGAR